MKVVSSVGAKGGSGKSSVSLLLAWELAKAHKSKVALLDADIQSTCFSAKSLNPKLPFEVVSVTDKDQLWAHGKKFEDAGFDYLIIDGNAKVAARGPRTDCHDCQAIRS